MFLGFTNFYRRFIRNFNRIATPLTSILWTTNKPTKHKAQSTQAENQDIPGVAGRVDGGGVGRNIENLSIVVNLAKSKKSKLTKPKKSDLPNKKVNSRTDFLTSGAKDAFIHL